MRPSALPIPPLQKQHLETRKAWHHGGWRSAPPCHNDNHGLTHTRLRPRLKGIGAPRGQRPLRSSIRPATRSEPQPEAAARRRCCSARKIGVSPQKLGGPQPQRPFGGNVSGLGRPNVSLALLYTSRSAGCSSRSAAEERPMRGFRLGAGARRDGALLRRHQGRFPHGLIQRVFSGRQSAQTTMGYPVRSQPAARLPTRPRRARNPGGGWRGPVCPSSQKLCGMHGHSAVRAGLAHTEGGHAGHRCDVLARSDHGCQRANAGQVSSELSHSWYLPPATGFVTGDH